MRQLQEELETIAANFTLEAESTARSRFQTEGQAAAQHDAVVIKRNADETIRVADGVGSVYGAGHGRLQHLVLSQKRLHLVILFEHPKRN